MYDGLGSKHQDVRKILLRMMNGKILKVVESAGVRVMTG